MLPPETSIGFVHLAVRDLGGTAAFHQDLLGFRPVERTADTVLLSSTGRPPLHLILTAAPDAHPRPRRSVGLYHFAILFPDRPALARTLAHLLDRGYPLHGASDHGVSEAIYFADPEGNGIEIYADWPRERWPVLDGAVTMPTVPLDVERLLAEAADPWAGMPSGTRIGHIHLHVSNLGRAEAFYAGVLGFDVTARIPGALFLAAGGYHHHIGLNTWAGTNIPPLAADAAGLRRFAVRLPDRPALDAILRRIAQAGLSPERAVDHGIGIAVTVRDPDGIPVSLWVDVRGAKAWRETPLALDSFIQHSGRPAD